MDRAEPCFEREGPEAGPNVFQEGRNIKQLEEAMRSSLEGNLQEGEMISNRWFLRLVGPIVFFLISSNVCAQLNRAQLKDWSAIRRAL